MTAGTSIAHRFADAFHTRDPARVADVFTPDGRYRDLFYGDHRGRAAIRDLFVRMYDDGHDHRWEMAAVVGDGSTTVAEWRFTFTVAGPSSRGGGRTLAFDGTSVFSTRGHVDPVTGYRRYRAEQIDDAVTIARLRSVGTGPDVIARVLAGGEARERALAGERRRLPPADLDRIRLPGGRAIGVAHRGPLTSLAAAYRVLLDAAGPHARGPVLEWYPSAPSGPSTPDGTRITVRTRAG